MFTKIDKNPLYYYPTPPLFYPYVPWYHISNPIKKPFLMHPFPPTYQRFTKEYARCPDLFNQEIAIAADQDLFTYFIIVNVTDRIVTAELLRRKMSRIKTTFPHVWAKNIYGGMLLYRGDTAYLYAYSLIIK